MKLTHLNGRSVDDYSRDELVEMLTALLWERRAPVWRAAFEDVARRQHFEVINEDAA